MLSRQNVEKENLCLKKRRELIDSGFLPKKQLLHIFELFKDGKKTLLIEKEGRLTKFFT